MRMSPADRQTIEANLTALRQELLDLKLEYELALAELPDVTLFALAPEFVYLTTDMGLYVDGYFLKQDIDWTDADLEGLTAYLQENAIRVVVHKWEPDDRRVRHRKASGMTASNDSGATTCLTPDC